MASNPPEGMQRIIPMLVYADAPAVLEFLTKAFGFEERFRLEMDDGRIGHAELGHHDNVVTLSSEFEGMGLLSPAKLSAHHAQVMCYVDDVDAHYERAKAAGAIIAAPPEDQPHGSRIYRAIDPEGGRWIFATHLRDVSPAEMSA